MFDAMTARYVLWPEVAAEIGFGHLMECCALAEALGRDQSVIVLPDWDKAREVVIGRGLRSASVDDADTWDRLTKDADWVVLNHRAVTVKAQKMASNGGANKVLVIDQLGGRTLDCDVLVNAAPVAEWQAYEVDGRDPERLLGPNYAVLRPEFDAYLEQKRVFRDAPRKVLISMGGVDRTGATIRVLKAMAKNPSSIHKHLVIGPGFSHEKDLANLRIKKDKSIYPHRDVTDLAPLMMDCDLLINAGGNTLYEAAALGLPAIVLFEDPHEEVFGQAFAAAGAARVLGSGMDTPLDLIADTTFNLLADKAERQAMSQAGKEMVSGQGAQRIAKAMLAFQSA